MIGLRSFLVCTTLAAATALLIVSAIAVGAIARTVERLPAAVLDTRTALLQEVSVTRTDLLSRVDSLQATADKRLASIQTDTKSELAATRELVAHELDASLSRVDTALAQVQGLRAELHPTLDNLAGISESALSVTRQIASASPLYLDCEFNADCLFNRVQGTSKAVERASINFGLMSAEIRDSLPQQLAAAAKLEEHAAGIAADVHTATSDFVKPQTFWQKFMAGLRMAAMIGARAVL